MKLFSPYFLLALLLLLLNDHFLKAAYPGFLSGKLSDFAGLFIFPYFFAALFPQGVKAIYWLSAIGFIWWKSAFATGFIYWWSVHIFPIGRVVDSTDLIALLIMPISYLLWKKSMLSKTQLLNRLSNKAIPLIRMLIMGVSFFAFIATTMAPRYVLAIDDFEPTYSFPFSETELRKRILDQYSYQRRFSARLVGKTMVQNEEVDSLYLRHEGIWLMPKNWDAYAEEVFEMTQDTIDISLWKPYSRRSIEAQIIISGDESRSSIQLLLLQGVRQRQYLKRQEQDSRKIKKRFERKFIDKLR